MTVETFGIAEALAMGMPVAVVVLRYVSKLTTHIVRAIDALETIAKKLDTIEYIAIRSAK